jgi:CRISPR-associated endonuclease Csn1
LSRVIVSHKRDHGKEGKLFKETALSKRDFLEEIPPDELKEAEICRIVPLSVRRDIESLVQKHSFKNAKPLFVKKYQFLRVFREKYVTRAPLTSLSARDIPNIADLRIRKQLLEFEPDKSLEERLLRFSQENKIYSVRYFPKDQTPIRINSVPNKWYMPADFYRVDIWRVPLKKGKYKYQGVFISRPEAEKSVSEGKPHPSAKFIMSLYKGDVIELSNGIIKELCLVKAFSTTQNKIDIRPIYAGGSISDWFKNTKEKLTSPFFPRDNKMEQNYKSINVLFSEYRVRLANITVDGRIFYQGQNRDSENC